MSEITAPHIEPPYPFEAYAHVVEPLTEDDGGGYPRDYSAFLRIALIKQNSLNNSCTFKLNSLLLFCGEQTRGYGETKRVCEVVSQSWRYFQGWSEALEGLLQWRDKSPAKTFQPRT